MKKNKSFSVAVFALLATAVFSLSSCSDKVYEEINTDPTKAATVNPSAQLTYAALQIYGDMNYADVHRLYTYAFTQHLMGCWNTTQYGGLHRMSDNEMSRPWNNLYPGSIRNLTDAIEQTKDDNTKVNLNAALRIMRVYVGSLLTDFYGDVPFTEAGLGYINGTTQPKYDKQEDIYRLFFTELKTAAGMFDNKQEAILSDPIFGGNIEAWKLFANSLRLRYAMRISDVLPTLAEQEFKDALSAGVFKSASDDALVKHMNVSFNFGQEAYKDFRGNALSKYMFGDNPIETPTFICQTLWDQLYNNDDPRTTCLCGFYVDEFMSLSSIDGRIDMTDAVMATQAANPAMTIIQSIVPASFWYDIWPSYTEIPGSEIAQKVAEIQVAHPDFKPGTNPHWVCPKISNYLMKSDNPGVLMTYAETCFLRAEAAAVLGWSTGDDAQTMYENGIRAAMDFLSTNYGCKVITDAEKDAYIAQPAIAYSPATAKEQINTQAWILHFHNPAEAWANQRRSDFPALTVTEFKRPLIDGTEIPVRLCYPSKEESYSKEAYQEAKDRVAGGYSWHARLWWDVK